MRKIFLFILTRITYEFYVKIFSCHFDMKNIHEIHAKFFRVIFTRKYFDVNLMRKFFASNSCYQNVIFHANNKFHMKKNIEKFRTTCEQKFRANLTRNWHEYRANFFARITWAARFVIKSCENFRTKLVSISCEFYPCHILLCTTKGYTYSIRREVYNLAV